MEVQLCKFAGEALPLPPQILIGPDGLVTKFVVSKLYVTKFTSKEFCTEQILYVTILYVTKLTRDKAYV